MTRFLLLIPFIVVGCQKTAEPSASTKSMVPPQKESQKRDEAKAVNIKPPEPAKFKKANENTEVAALIAKKRWLFVDGMHLIESRPVVELSVSEQNSFDHITLTNEEVATLAKATQIQSFDLSKVKLTDSQLKLLCQIPQLESITLSGGQITDQGLKHLANCPELAEVFLSSTKTTDAGIQELAKIPKLAVLHISSMTLSGSCFEAFTKSTLLKRLILHIDGVTDAGLKYLGEIPNLQVLIIRKGFRPVSYTSEGLKEVISKRIPAIFDFEHSLLDDALLAQLVNKGWLHGPTPAGTKEKRPATAEEVTKIDLENSKVTDQGLATLSHLVNLNTVLLGKTKLTAASFNTLAKFKKLEHISVDNMTITASQLQAIQSLPIKHLSLENCTLDEGCFKAIGQMTNLTILSLPDSDLKGTWLSHIRSLTQLEELSLKGASEFSITKRRIVFTDGDTQHLTSLKSLRTLLLNNTSIGDASLAELIKLPNLASLHLANTKVTKEAIAAAQKLKPMISIYKD